MTTLVLGLGITGQAVVEALWKRRQPVVAVDDRPSAEARSAMEELGVELVAAPDETRLASLVAAAESIVPAPGLPASHKLFGLAARADVPIISEFDLAARWDDRPLLAVTGTDGKTTVTTLASEMLDASALNASVVGNTPVPLVRAIDDPMVDVFVVEASSFRLAHSQHFAPAVGTWLNFAPDHLDNHTSLDEYEWAKARLWRDQSSEQVAVGNADDPVVERHLAAAAARQVRFGMSARANYRIENDQLVTERDEVVCRVDDLPRRYPHDLMNALAALATALNGGATLAGVRTALQGFGGLPHRVTLVGESGGVGYVDDSKATTPHAVLAAVSGFDSVVLICGGRNKGLDLSVLADARERLRAVVAIGEAAGEVADVFEGHVPVQLADSMDHAVKLASAAAKPGDTVLLSPGCASFDWYSSYAERGDDFARALRQLLGKQKSAYRTFPCQEADDGGGAC